MICDKTPDQLKLKYALWTRQAVRELIRGALWRHVCAAIPQRGLKRWGFTPATAP